MLCRSQSHPQGGDGPSHGRLGDRRSSNARKNSTRLWGPARVVPLRGGSNKRKEAMPVKATPTLPRGLTITGWGGRSYPRATESTRGMGNLGMSVPQDTGSGNGFGTPRSSRRGRALGDAASHRCGVRSAINDCGASHAEHTSPTDLEVTGANSAPGFVDKSSDTTARALGQSQGKVTQHL